MPERLSGEHSIEEKPGGVELAELWFEYFRPKDMSASEGLDLIKKIQEKKKEIAAVYFSGRMDLVDEINREVVEYVTGVFDEIDQVTGAEL